MVKVGDTLGKFSVINTQIDIEVINNIRYVKKEIRPNISLPCSIHQLKTLIDEYIDEILGAGIPMPKIKESYIENDILKHLSVYEGSNIIQAFTIDGLTHGEGLSVLDEIINILIKAQKGGIFLDPHPKNFVWNGHYIHYVDFTPPYSKKFMEMRIGLANNEELPIVEKNFSYFSPENLFYHFAGDFFNVNQKLPEDFVVNLYRRLISAKAIKTSYSNFIDRAKEIRELEDLRLKKGIYLF